MMANSRVSLPEIGIPISNNGIKPVIFVALLEVSAETNDFKSPSLRYVPLRFPINLSKA